MIMYDTSGCSVLSHTVDVNIMIILYEKQAVQTCSKHDSSGLIAMPDI